MSTTKEQIELVSKTIEYMKKNIEEEITSEKLAELAGYSLYHFTRVFKDVTGISPRHFLSALRIEAGKEKLIGPSSGSILRTLLEIGFQSFGTFSSKFKQFVGQSPKQFQNSAVKLHRFMNDYDEVNLGEPVSVKSPAVRCTLEVPVFFKGIIFVGLFPRPIPDQRPVVGIALRGTKKEYVFSKVPPGTYFALATAIPWSLNPRDYFLLSKNLRGKADCPVEISENNICIVNIKLREPLPYDPPILINLPSLLFEKDSKLEEK
ncbi:helix-turn-helix domain-containing protein [Mesobacillus jeotgali]|uniref:helix-turn-helix domain-containing protein n=1 Tax=Mesobacillus jeotgali TaxID=129985 RepID=UPI000C8667ED|nr:AraC family transcriptional regulator [Mesobacillus jeotgali]